MPCSYCHPHLTASLCGTSSPGCCLFTELWLCSPPRHLHWEMEGMGGEKVAAGTKWERNPWPPFGLLQGISAAPPHCHIAPFHPLPPGGAEAANGELKCEKLIRWPLQEQLTEGEKSIWGAVASGQTFVWFVNAGRSPVRRWSPLVPQQFYPSNHIFHMTEAAQHVVF